MSKSLTYGVDVYEEWHSKEPSQLKTVKVDPPDRVYACGKGELIAYRSGKWQKGNNTEDYEHLFTSKPTVYHSTGEGRVRSVGGLLKNDTIISLGYCIELTVIGFDGQEYEFPIGRSRKPRMVCTTDKKTVIVLHSKGPIFINGGSMRVTDRGIVK